MYEVSYISPDGEVLNLTSPDSPVRLVGESIDGLKGETEEDTSAPLGESGSVVLSQRIVPSDGSIDLRVWPSDTQSLAQGVAKVRKAFHHSRPGELIIRSPTRGPLRAEVCRRGGIAALPTDLSSASSEKLHIPLKNWSGVWWTTVYDKKGNVTVMNSGDVEIWVNIHWSGQGGQVTLPSGLVFDLPPTSQPRTLLLNRRDSAIVIDHNGNIDDDLWDLVKNTALPEGVPIGQSRVFALPEGASLLWRVGVMDPWI